MSCDEKWRLLRDFMDSVSNINRIQTAQVIAVLKGDGFQHQQEFVKAVDRKDHAKCAVIAHIHQHGC